jgi:hypothetical protein
MSQADTDDNGGVELTPAEKKELTERAAAYLARENRLPK